MKDKISSKVTVESETFRINEPAPSAGGWTVFCMNLDEECSEEEIYDLFADYGEIKDIYILANKATLMVKGFALVKYGNYQEAERAISDLNGKLFYGKSLRVEFAFLKDSGDQIDKENEAEDRKEINQPERVLEDK